MKPDLKDTTIWNCCWCVSVTRKLERDNSVLLQTIMQSRGKWHGFQRFWPPNISPHDDSLEKTFTWKDFHL